MHPKGTLRRILMPRLVAANKHTKIRETTKKTNPIIMGLFSSQSQLNTYKKGWEGKLPGVLRIESRRVVRGIVG